MSWKFYDEEGVLRAEADDTARVTREWDEHGTLIRETPYTPEELAALQERINIAHEEANETVLRSGMQNVIDAALERQAQAQAVIDTPNSEINNRPAPHIVALARVCKRQERAIIRLARLVGGLVESADTGTD